MTFWDKVTNVHIRNICREVMDRDLAEVSPVTEGKDYGTNNCHAYDAGECPQSFDTSHHFTRGKELGRCYSLEICELCGAKHKVDSSD